MFVPPNPTIFTAAFAGFIISLIGNLVTTFVIAGPDVMRQLSQFSSSSRMIAKESSGAATRFEVSSRVGNILAVILATAIIVVVGLVWWSERAA